MGLVKISAAGKRDELVEAMELLKPGPILVHYAGEVRAAELFLEGRSLYYRSPFTGGKRRVFRRFQPASKMVALIQRDGLLCHWCGLQCDPCLSSNADLFPTKDHVIRRADGGSNDLSNLVVACRKCNNTRHNDVFAVMRRREATKERT